MLFGVVFPRGPVQHTRLRARLRECFIFVSDLVALLLRCSCVWRRRPPTSCRRRRMDGTVSLLASRPRGQSFSEAPSDCHRLFGRKCGLCPCADTGFRVCCTPPSLSHLSYRSFGCFPVSLLILPFASVCAPSVANALFAVLCRRFVDANSYLHVLMYHTGWLVRSSSASERFLQTSPGTGVIHSCCSSLGNLEQRTTLAPCATIHCSPWPYDVWCLLCTDSACLLLNHGSLTRSLVRSHVRHRGKVCGEGPSPCREEWSVLKNGFSVSPPGREQQNEGKAEVRVPFARIGYRRSFTHQNTHCTA